MLRLLILFLPAMLAAQTVFVVRHAERTGEPDPPLNEIGCARARALSQMLADAGVTQVFASDTLRAQETGSPTAASANCAIEVYPQTTLDALVTRIRSVMKPGKSILVVGHRETVPKIVELLGATTAPLESGEHNRLIVVTLAGTPLAVTLRYEP